jgi:hypothetical protein
MIKSLILSSIFINFSYSSEINLIKDIPFAYGKDGCFARAHKMAMVLDEDQVISGKAFIKGRFYVQTINGPAFWTYHVAPVVMVKDGDKAGLSKSRKLVFLEEYFTNRFSYGPEDKDKTYSNYSDASITDMNIQNKKKLEILSRK